MLVLRFIWTIALVGIGLTIYAAMTNEGKSASPAKLKRQQQLSLAANSMYLGLGWCALTFLQPLVSSMSYSAITWMVAGGLLYSVGFGCFYVNTSLPYQVCRI